jgi:predicted DNA-binding transcriptional regulator YafY
VYRRAALLDKLAALGGLHHGVQAELARSLGVSEATISRDVKTLFRTFVQCPTCHSIVHRDVVRIAPPGSAAPNA